MENREEVLKDLELLKNNLERANQFSNIKDTEITSYRTAGSGMVKMVKRVIRKMIYWFVKPYWDQQVEFNLAIKNAVEDIYRIQSRLVGQDVSFFEETMDDENYKEIVETKERRIIQIVSSLNFGDAVGNDVMAIQNYLRKDGFVTGIFTNNIHVKIPKGTAYLIDKLPELRKDDLVLYHFASEDPLAELIKKVPCEVVLRYHNVTPPHFFKGFDAGAEQNTRRGLLQIKELAPYIDYGMVVSEFNKNDLKNMGYSCPIDVAPILIQFDDYKKTPSAKVVNQYSDGRTNVVFVGRMAPNKKIEDVISAFAVYKEKYDNTARLFLVGNYNEEDKYYKYLRKHIAKLKVEDVIFPGHIPFDEILGYYTIANIFLCMSEHEGFCVPLAEAMFFNVPIVAYSSSAIPSTLNGSGVLLEDKDFNHVAKAMHDVMTDENLRNEVLAKEEERLKDFDNARIGKEICKQLSEIMKENKGV